MTKTRAEKTTLLGYVFDLSRTAIIFAAVIIIAFSAPMFAHAGMGDHNQTMDQAIPLTEMDHGSDHTGHMDMPGHSIHSDEHSEMGCCYGICALVVLLPDLEHEHLAQSDSYETSLAPSLTSVDVDGLIRPPNA